MTTALGRRRAQTDSYRWSAPSAYESAWNASIRAKVGVTRIAATAGPQILDMKPPILLRLTVTGFVVLRTIVSKRGRAIADNQPIQISEKPNQCLSSKPSPLSPPSRRPLHYGCRTAFSDIEVGCQRTSHGARTRGGYHTRAPNDAQSVVDRRRQDIL